MENSHGGKTAAIKTLAIIGFFATVGLIVWLLVQGLRVVPGTFASLASLAESLQRYGGTTELTIATEKSVVVSDESFKLAWTDLGMKGTYEFSSSCVEGVEVEVQGDGERVSIPCTQALSLPADVHGLFVSIKTRDERFVDVPMHVAFKREDGETLIASDATVTVVNASIPLAGTPEIAGADENATTSPSETIEPEVVAETPTPAPQPAPAVTPVPKPTPTYTTVVTKPTSNPYGTVDLKITYLGVGEMNGNTFVSASNFDRSERNGLKFEVKNVGTKISGTWTFKIELPSGITYTSDAQPVLMPTEGAIFTLGFDMDEEETAKTVTVKGTVSEKNDAVKSNNTFSHVVTIVK